MRILFYLFPFVRTKQLKKTSREPENFAKSAFSVVKEFLLNESSLELIRFVITTDKLLDEFILQANSIFTAE